MKVSLVGGPADGREVTLADPSTRRILLPRMLAAEVVFVPENAAMWKEDSQGRAYYYCADGTYRRPGCVSEQYCLAADGCWRHVPGTRTDAEELAELEWHEDL
jgi:hypothetical protein